MSIFSLSSKQYSLIKNGTKLPFRDVAYRRASGLRSFYMSPYKLKELYGLRGSYRDNPQMDDLAKSISKSPDLYLTDLGDLSSIGKSIQKLIDTRNSITVDPAFRPLFDNVFDYFSERNIKLRSTAWFGYDVRNSEMYAYVTGTKKVYPKLEEANRFFDRFEADLKINPETDVPRPRTIFTSKATGIFTFSRVAPTLYAFPCYKVDESDEQCISPSSVVRKDDGYYLKDAQDVQVGIYGYEQRDSGQPKFRTQAKKVYATKDNKIKITPYINIYVNIVASADVDAESYRYNSFAAVALAKLLVGNGFKVSITSMFTAKTKKAETLAHSYPYDARDPVAKSSATGSGKREAVFVNLFSIKSYNELLDFNTSLIYGGDPAFFRYDMFQAHCSAAWMWWRTLPESLGAPVTDEYEIEDLLDRYNINNLENETRVVISGRFSLNRAQDAVRTKLAALRVLYGGGS
jgi:hypothetical protein